MKNELQIFNNPDFGEIRTVEIDGQVWFAGKDIAEALGYSNPQKAIRDHVDDEDRTVNDLFTVNGTAISLINESGLYSLVMGSKLPGAKAFKRWVTSEVLPAIRRNGTYSRPKTAAEMFYMQAEINVALEKRMDGLEKTVAEAAEMLSAPSVQKDAWQERTNRTISEIVENNGLSHQAYRGELYAKLENRTGCDLAARQRNLRKRMKKAGATHKEAEAITKLHVIARDDKLRELFGCIVQQERAKFICRSAAERSAAV